MSFKTLLVGSATSLVVCAFLVTICYFFVDRPVAYFVHDNDLRRFEILDWLTHIPDVVEYAATIVIPLGVIRLVRGPFTRVERMFFAAAIGLAVALMLKDSLKVAFGRYWPTTWIFDNPALIPGGDYGFHPFHTSMAYASFPSGHTTRICAVMAVAWVGYPRWRWLCVLACGAVAVGLVGMNYHFVGDVVAGAFVGSITGVYAAHFFRLDASQGDAR